uniref:Reverse transcriptase domain-containing protein n=1 Tax=Tanacetum cinerariifolium TaxID=118510 RepID=A0A6L2NNV4_TANCI|nr:reverse transcriptase domain-containing protein [Tanacetum cinerariifolium]
MDAMTLKIDAQYKELQSNAKKAKPDLDKDDIPMSREEDVKFMQTFHDETTLQPKIQNPKPVKGTPLPKSGKPKIPYPQRLRKEKMEAQYEKFLDMIHAVRINMEEDRKVILILGRPFLHTADAVIRVKQKQLNIGIGTERMIFNIDSIMKHSYSKDDTCFSIDVIDEILEEDFDALLDEGSKSIHSIEGTYLEKEIFTVFDVVIAMTVDENSDSESDTEEPPFEKVTINTNCKIKTSLEEPPTDLELKPLPNDLDYVFIEEPSFLPEPSKVKRMVKTFTQSTSQAKPLTQLSKNTRPKAQDVKPRLIRWILLLQEFDIEIKDRKGKENAAVDHLSRIENDELSDDSEVNENFPEETLMEINTKDEP